MTPKTQALIQGAVVSDEDRVRIERLEGMLAKLSSLNDETTDKLTQVDKESPEYRTTVVGLLNQIDRRRKRYSSIDILLAEILDRLRATRVRA